MFSEASTTTSGNRHEAGAFEAVRNIPEAATRSVETRPRISEDQIQRMQADDANHANAIREKINTNPYTHQFESYAQGVIPMAEKALSDYEGIIASGSITREEVQAFRGAFDQYQQYLISLNQYAGSYMQPTEAAQARAAVEGAIGRLTAAQESLAQHLTKNPEYRPSDMYMRNVREQNPPAPERTANVEQVRPNPIQPTGEQTPENIVSASSYMMDKIRADRAAQEQPAQKPTAPEKKKRTFRNLFGLLG